MPIISFKMTYKTPSVGTASSNCHLQITSRKLWNSVQYNYM